MQTAMYQNRLALDYFLAEKGGVCDMLNQSACCLHIDDHGQPVTEMANNIRKMAHVPV
jgi:hypothetical protein